MNPPIDPTSGETSAIIPAKGGRRPKDYAFRTIPPGLVVKPSGVPGAGLGVWASQCLRKGLVLGPYQGVRVDWEFAAHKSEYCWEVAIPIYLRFELFFVDCTFMALGCRPLKLNALVALRVPPLHSQSCS